MKLNPDSLRVVSFETQEASTQALVTLLPNDTSAPTAATMCEICATDSACW